LKAELQNPAGEAGACPYRSDDIGTMFRTTFILILIAMAEIFVIFNHGGNNLAHAFASAIGFKALKIKLAFLIDAV
jgi:hypothetical protein